MLQIIHEKDTYYYYCHSHLTDLKIDVEELNFLPKVYQFPHGSAWIQIQVSYISDHMLICVASVTPAFPDLLPLLCDVSE